ncbi:hypothetical protein [Vibrio sp. WXL210]|uniref:hypothetical protein n=1 Tax=Vibrio sp. WXL210 TaxID=3450709 RepID=UPI003EC7B4AD
MNKATLILAVAGLSITGCGSHTASYTTTKPPINVYEVGNKTNAKGVALFDYVNTRASPEYQRYQVVLYFDQLPIDETFPLCAPATVVDDCKSHITIHENPLTLPGRKPVWVDYNLTLLESIESKGGQSLPNARSMMSRTSVNWNTRESLHYLNRQTPDHLETLESFTVQIKRL